MAFNKLLLEIARRKQYKEAAENIVQGIMRQLDSMSEGTVFPYRFKRNYLISRHSTEENRVRAHFNAEYGQHLPEDLCLCIGNAPTRWEVVPWDGTVPETLPAIDADLIAEVGFHRLYIWLEIHILFFAGEGECGLWRWATRCREFVMDIRFLFHFQSPRPLTFVLCGGPFLI